MGSEPMDEFDLDISDLREPPPAHVPDAGPDDRLPTPRSTIAPALLPPLYP